MDIYSLLKKIEEFLLCQGDIQQVVVLHQAWKEYTAARKHGKMLS